MTFQPDHVLVAVRYSTDENSRQIGSVLALKKFRGWGPNTYEMTKQEVIQQISFQNKKVFTAYQTRDGLQLGDEVEAVPHNNPRYIRTVGNNRLEDNLGELPEY